ncbi:hypothetical protein PSENEW3_00005505 [Picochlorum sp. SENEW3]|nr:hypothetical protein PSENEW3_00005505 [Picochlorum sp. SENEW3]
MAKAKNEQQQQQQGGASEKEANKKSNGVAKDVEMAKEDGDMSQVRKEEDAILEQGEEIASRRALIAQAFKPPCLEPERPLSHWSHVLGEMKWLAVDVAQERLWKQSVAFAIAVEIGKMQGDFGLKQPPEDCRQFSNEIKQLKLEAAKAAGQATGRRSVKATNLPKPAVLLGLNAEEDPALAEIDEGVALLKKQAKEIGEKPDTVVDLAENNVKLTLPWDDATTEKMEHHLYELEKQRLIQEEAQFRSYRLEYEAALASHQLAIAEQQAAANAIDGFEIGQSLDLDLMDDGLLGPPRRYKKRRTGYAVDEYDDRKLDGYADRRRAKAYRDGDTDPNYSAETGRYGRRAAGRNRRPLNDRNRNFRQRQDHYAQGGRVQGQPGILSWSRNEDDLLLAIVHEFGVNWTLVSEVLSRSLSLQGIHRPPQQCRHRFRQLITQEGQSLTDEKAYELLTSRLAKQQARELLLNSLPVRNESLVRFLEALAQVGASARNRRLAEEKRCESIRTQRQEPHTSHKSVVNGIMQQTGGRHLTPLELSAHVMNTYAQQARQIQAPYNPNQPPQQGGPDGSNGQIGGPPTVQQMSAPGQGMARPGGGSVAMNIQQLTNILNANKLPNGSELTDEMRKALEEKKRAYLVRLTQSHKAAMAQRQGLTPSQISSGTAMASMQVNARPQMGTVVAPGMNMYAGNPGPAQGVTGVPAQGAIQQGVAILPGGQQQNQQYMVPRAQQAPPVQGQQQNQ